MFTTNEHAEKMNMRGGIMIKTEAETNIIYRAFNTFNKETGLITAFDHKETYAFDKGWDGEIKIATPNQEHEAFFLVEIKKRVTTATIGHIAYKFAEIGNRGVLVAEYINPRMAARLKNKGIQFVDACGNAFIKKYPFFIYIKGNKQVEGQYKRIVGPKAFTAMGLKILYTLLCNPGFENMPFREIATAADVALGTVNAVIKNLIETGFLIDRGKMGRKLINKENLLERWVIAYPETLRPRLVLGKFTAKDKYWWQTAELPELFFWGGEVAAKDITQYLKPEVITVYTHTRPDQLLLNNKLRKHPEGEVEFLKAFWKKGFNWYQRNTVHPILVYADLLTTGDERNLETAKIIYENELVRFIK